MDALLSWPKQYDTKGLIIRGKGKDKEGLILTPTDFQRARGLHEAERLDIENNTQVFRGLIYTVLTQRTSYTSQATILTKLCEQGLTTPEALAKTSELPQIITGVLYPQQLARHVQALAGEWWGGKGLQFIQELQADDTNGKKQGNELRNYLATTCPGIGDKCASLFMRMCGYTDVVPLDRWAIRALKELLGARVHSTHDKRRVRQHQDKYTRGLRHTDYVRYEKKWQKEAAALSIPPASLQMILYAHKTKWDHERHPFLEP